MQNLPEPRGPLTSFLLEGLRADPPLGAGPAVADANEDDLQLALSLSYELHYRGLAGVAPQWEWEPSLLAFRRSLERRFEFELFECVGDPVGAPGRADVEGELRHLAADPAGPSLSRHLQGHATVEQFQEFVVHRSIYQLKEADPHSWAIPRLTGRPKAALVEIQSDEYGAGRAERMHSVLFATTMRALGLDDHYGAYLSIVPGVTLATVNLMSFLGLHRRWRAALAGHLALFEMTSSVPNRRYGAGLRRLGLGADATEFFDEHVVADSTHELIALRDLVGPLADEQLGADVLFGARALALLDDRASNHLLRSWESGRPSLRSPLAAPLVA
jgi:hypothetical protein